MTSITEYFKQAELALAAYAKLGGINFVDQLKEAGMSDAQATRFARDWRVIDQYTHSELVPVLDEFNQPTDEYTTVSNGLSVTLFQENATGQRYLAIRGTDDISDIITDWFSIALIGSTKYQDQYAQLKAKITEWLADPARLGGRTFTVAGHSLGGFLATALTADFGANVSHTYLFNTPGIGGIDLSGLGPVGMLLNALRASATTVDAGKFTNLRAEAGASPIAGLGLPVSPVIPIQIEDQFLSDIPNPPAARNHSQQTLTDALAVYALCGELAPALTIPQITQLLKSASSTNKGTLESAIDALRIALLGSAALPGADPGVTAKENRESLYKNLYTLQDSTAYKALKGSAAARLTATLSRDELVTKAKTDFGSFLAVKYLLPVAIEGAASALSAVHSDLYAQWQADQVKRNAGSTDLDFSDEYLTDRAAFLTWKNRLALEDADASGAPYNKSDAPDVWFRDNATNLTINLGSGAAPADKRRFIFDGDTGNTLSGGSQADNLYGGGGNDVLYGHAQDDRLEGGAGNDGLYGGDGEDVLVGGAGDDRLEGGKDFDTYLVGQGADTVQDADGKGVLRDGNGRAMVGLFVKDSDGNYKWATDGAIIATREGADLRLALGEGCSVLLKEFASGQLGIRLAETVIPATANTILGDRHPAEYTGVVFQVSGGAMQGIGSDWVEINWLNDWYEGDTHYWNIGYRRKDAWGNYITDADQPGRDDALNDTSGADLIQSGGGGDLIDATRGGDDRIEAGAGLDFVSAGAGADLVIGGTEQDILRGGVDDDRLFALSQTDLDAAIVQGDQAAGTGLPGDWLIGDLGDDQIVGSAADDQLFGGGGADLIVGGAGNDIIDGDDDYQAIPQSIDASGYVWAYTIDRDHFDVEWQNLFSHEQDARLVGAGDVIYAGAGDDVLLGLMGNDILFGESGNDLLAGGDADDTLLGGEDNDLMTGDGGKALDGDSRPIAQGNDYLDGGAGDDWLQGEAGNDRLFGGDGNDELWGDAQTYTLEAARHGDDWLATFSVKSQSPQNGRWVENDDEWRRAA